MRKLGLLFVAVFLSNVIFAQMVVLNKKVTGFHKFPIKNIVVKCKKSKTKALTDKNGEFEIVCMPNDVLLFESESFIKQRVKVINLNDSVKVNLVFKDTPKSKEYALAYGIISKEDLTYAISNLTNENKDFEN